jgi:hypothetical protein
MYRIESDVRNLERQDYIHPKEINRNNKVNPKKVFALELYLYSFRNKI